VFASQPNPNFSNLENWKLAERVSSEPILPLSDQGHKDGFAPRPKRHPIFGGIAGIEPVRCFGRRNAASAEFWIEEVGSVLRTMQLPLAFWKNGLKPVRYEDI